VLLSALLFLLPFQDPPPQPPPETRASQIEAEREAKQASIVPAPSDDKGHNPLEAIGSAIRIWNFTQAGTRGFSLRLGGLAYNSGFALGPEYIFKRGDLYDPGFIWDSYAVGSYKGYYRVESRVQLPKLLHDHAFFSAAGFRYDYPQLDYYGPGPTSSKTGRANYRMQDNDAEIRGGFQFAHRLRIGLVGSYQRIHIDPGTDHDVAQIDALYTPAQAPGIALQTNFLTGGFFAEYEGRDQPLDPHAGTYVFAQFQNVDGTRRSLGGFNEYDFQAQEYVPFWNKRRVVALRLRADLTAPHQNTFVPFYLEPRLGGPDDLRGFRPYRFYDQNAVTATAEYRWTVVEAMDMALFADAGKVYHNWDSFTLAHTQADIGFGLRAKAGSSVPFRVDFGFSREGVQVWLAFYNVF
jgi:outer membrane protein assembly factor BamA